MEVTLEFAGGAELLFGNAKRKDIILEASKTWRIADLLVWMRDNILTERPELFLQNDDVRPGILVLVNDVDWELMGEKEYAIKAKDNILFISTLHGG